MEEGTLWSLEPRKLSSAKMIIDAGSSDKITSTEMMDQLRLQPFETQKPSTPALLYCPENRVGFHSAPHKACIYVVKFQGPAPSHPSEWHFGGSPSSHPGNLTITIPPSRGVAFTQSVG
ncbi:hypothetical protein FCV25MIE_18906 [Fagus crenata]